MSGAPVSLKIEGIPVSVPPGTLIVDAAKRAGIDIPVFCYHPKMQPVGMCRMCLVEVGRPTRDRASGELLRDQAGRIKVSFNGKLETACTTPVEEGSEVRVQSAVAVEGRKQIVEYLLTSHPLDCPVCDKGGECPLQNLTMEHGPGQSRFRFEDKMRLEKHVALGDLIFLDRERCIQCGRCVRFQDELVGEPVLALAERGRQLEIVTYSTPGFDSIFSGNTTDICPVGALTTADFRFGARPWELNVGASICTHCPVGCNLAVNTRREAGSSGQFVVKRMLPRQNEAVNEIWICDKGRFAHHFASSPQRLLRPLVRQNGQLIEATWEEALTAAAEGLRRGGPSVVGLASGRASNEDLFSLRRLVTALEGHSVLQDAMAGGDVVAQHSGSEETNLGQLGKGDAILVVAAELHEEAPIWWYRSKRAVEHGADLILVEARPTRLDKYAVHRLTFPHGKLVDAILGLAAVASGDVKRAGLPADESFEAVARTLRAARNVVVLFGREGQTLASSASLATACAELLTAAGHPGASGRLIGVWPRANTQGAWDMGWRPDPHGLNASLRSAQAVYAVASDPAGDDPEAAQILSNVPFLVVQELFLTPTAKLAHVVLPAQSFLEREGSFTSGDRRVQRFYPVIPPSGETRPDWEILGQVAERLGQDARAASASMIMDEIARSVPDYSGVSYQAMGRSAPQWPPVGEGDLYFGGTSQKNGQGTGVALTSSAQPALPLPASLPAQGAALPAEGILLVPIDRLLDRGTTVVPSDILSPRLARLRLEVSSSDAERLGLREGGEVELRLAGRIHRLDAIVSSEVPAGVALLPRSLGIPLDGPSPASLKATGI
jgi:NADH-quinone oxidoreductase subunit G